MASPTLPIIAILATETNYPAGGNAWNGQPIKVAPASDYVTPNTKPPAQTFNFWLNGITTELSTVLAFALATDASAQLWHPAWLASGIGAGCTWYGACWDPIQLQWVTIGNESGAGMCLFTSYGADDGNTIYWSGAGVLPVHTVATSAAVCTDPSVASQWWAATTVSTTDFYVQVINGASATALHFSGLTGATSCEIISFAGYIICALGSSVSSETGFFSNPSTTLNWATFHALLPAVACAHWILRTDNATIALALPYNVVRTTTPDYYYTPDGDTWTTAALSTTLLLGTNYVIKAACWSPALQSFFAIVDAGGTPFVFSSPDGKTWTSVATSLGVGVTPSIVDMAAIGSCLVATQADSGGGSSRLIFSPDGGVTWYNAPASFESSQNGGTGYTRARLAQGEEGLLALNNLWGRFSAAAALPSAHL